MSDTQSTTDMNQNLRSHSNPKTRKSIRPTSTSGKKSKYAKKFHGKKHQKPVAKPRGPVNEYISQCCGTPALKPRCGEKVNNSEAVRGLGHFHCTGCRKVAKVTVRKPQPKEEPKVEPTEVPIVS